MPDLCSLDDVKTWLGLGTDANPLDETLQRLISAKSADFLGRIRRPGFTPELLHTDTINVSNWQTDPPQEIFLRHYPVAQITSVSINGVDIDEFNEATPATPGWFFDTELDYEDRQKISMIGFCPPAGARTSAYRPGSARVVVTYVGGYPGDIIPEDVVEAVIEWVGYSKGLSELQQKDQSAQWLQIGQFQQNTSIATSSVKFSGIDMPMSVQTVIAKYQRPVI